MARREPRHCSFCGKGQDQVRKLVAGPGDVYICDGCVRLCNEIMSEARPPRRHDGSPGQWVRLQGTLRRRGLLGWFRNLFHQQVRRPA